MWGPYGIAVDNATHLWVADSRNNRVLLFTDEGNNPPPTYSISGKVLDVDNNPISNVTIADDKGHTTTTHSDGTYTLNNLTQGSYTLTPSKDGYTFSPPSQSVQVPLTAPITDFVASLQDPSLCTLSNFGDDNGNPISQKDLKWAGEPYGGGIVKLHDGSLRFLPFVADFAPHDDIAHWGCNLTAWVMIINYFAKLHNVVDSNTGNIFQTDPKILNKWLQENNGYIIGFNTTNPLPKDVNPTSTNTSFVNPASVIDYAAKKKVFLKIGKYDVYTRKDTKTHNLIYSSISDFNDKTLNSVNSIICQQPVILGVVNSYGLPEGHFVVATGQPNGNTSPADWRIHDPLTNPTSPKVDEFSKYNGTYTSFRQVLYDQTRASLSMIVPLPRASVISASLQPNLVANESFHLVVIDPLGRYFSTDQVDGEYDEIPGLQYHVDTTGSDGMATQSAIEIYIDAPQNGTYIIEVYGASKPLLTISAFDNDGIYSYAQIDTDNVSRYIIRYSSDSGSQVQVEARFVVDLPLISR